MVNVEIPVIITILHQTASSQSDSLSNFIYSNSVSVMFLLFLLLYQLCESQYLLLCLISFSYLLSS